MRRRFIELFVLFLLVGNAAATVVPLPAGIEANALPGGMLHDRVVSLAGIEHYDGAEAAPPATLAVWRQLVHELRRSAVVAPDWPATRRPAAAKSVDPARIPVQLLHAEYGRLDEDGTVATARVFAAAAVRETTYRGDRVVFALDRIVGDTDLRRLAIDPGDGDGWRPLAGAEARYAATGPVVVRLRAETSTGVTLAAGFRLEIAALQTPTPDAVWTIQAATPYDGIAGSGTAYIRLSDRNPTLANPVIVVEGFDLDDSMGWDELHALLNRENLLDDLRAEGYDAVVLDFDAATAPIQRNADVLAELIAQVNAAIPPGRTTALVGASMGGLVARYCLGELQEQGVDHRVRTWIAFDSPQRGAVIPLGLQHWLDFFRDDSESAAYLLGRLDTPAARQMLLYHHGSTSGSNAAPDPALALFEAELHALPLPDVLRVAVANGSGAATGQGLAPGQQLIRYRYRSLLLDLDGNVWAVPDGVNTRIFQGVQNVIWPLPDTYQDVYAANTLPWDGAPGGWRASMAQMDTTAVPYGDIEALFDAHCFVPTVSALDLADVGPFHDIAGDPDLLTRTQFDRVYTPTANQEHVLITPENKIWLMDAIREGIVDVPTATTAQRLRAEPNPFNPATVLRFDLPTRQRAELVIYDFRGRRVRTLLDARLSAGEQTIRWDGRDEAGRSLPSGVYLARLRTDAASTARKVVLAR